MEPFVLDSSFSLAWCFADEKTPRTDTIRAWLQSVDAIVPPLWKWEVTNGLLMAVKRKRISREDALASFAFFQTLPIRTDIQWMDVTSDSLFQLAEANALTVYDAAYLELSTRLKLPLATLDMPLERAARNAGVTVL